MDGKAMQRVLMCPPDYYGVYYEINPWMRVARPADHERACRQWQDLVELYHRLGVRIHLLEPVEGLPDMVFTANAGVLDGDRAVVSRFRPPERQGEEPYLERWFADQGYTVLRLPEGLHFEGSGDAKFFGGTLYGGYPIRSDRAAQARVGELLGAPVETLRLRDPQFYHLDTCFAVLRPDLVMYYPPAFAPASRRKIAALPAEKIAVTDEDARDFACNCVVFGDEIVLNRASPALERALGERGFRVHRVDVSEFLKAGGGTGCLTLVL
jgi:N-dimethylarginine dimethylaminohydrolase